nr:hypothetical protein [Pseudomonas syringae group genomosp. 3]
MRASNSEPSTRSASTVEISLTLLNRPCKKVSSEERLSKRSIPKASVLKKTDVALATGSLINHAPASSASSGELSPMISLSTLGRPASVPGSILAASSRCNHLPSSLLMRELPIAS